ncbi:response regulator [Starkeya sp. ORNL1]|uniref:hybrid sensor histidine kinase/response regulator n=1 Tax=Starkeya sp. ORNL1 TaxID=2709380 RepID=UPI00146403A0|nr:hybrid sensor histidine kinase/response regulator [Starkeya sp. ORNL1]QJP13992.1 response regulator [Starkeya sp. ORNL1]
MTISGSISGRTVSGQPVSGQPVSGQPVSGQPVSGQVLLLAPHGRDAAIATALVRDAGLAAVTCRDIAEFHAAIDNETYFAVATQEALIAADLRPLQAYLAQQPTWSDLPFVVLTHHAGGPDRTPGAALLSEMLGNVTFLERPFHPTTFISVARTAHKGRLRQFEARARIDELHEGEQRLQTALVAGRLGSLEFDLETGVLSTSATCKSLFGRRADEGLSYQDLVASIHPDDRGRTLEAVQRSITSGIDYAIEYRTVWPDGTVRWVEIRARMVFDRKGAKRRLVGVASDVTARRNAEEEMRGLNEVLESRVAERTAELNAAHAVVLAEIEQRKRTEEQLRQVQKIEMIGQLTGGVAHDFNNLLMAVLGNLELLRKQVPLDPRAARLVDGAVQGAQRGAALTQRLLAFARRQDLDVVPTDLGNLVRGMGNLLERSVGSQIELQMSIPDDLPRALIDANQIELALLNLAVNARDAMPDGGVLSIALDAVKVGAREPGTRDDIAPGDYVRLRVVDTGEGMDAKTLAKATEPFFSTKELGKGTGLGLSMIHGLAVQLNGALRLSSEPGRGTVAEIWVPVTAEPAPAAPLALAAIEDAPRATILVVDDDALISMSTVEMLEDLGHEVIEANSGDRALEILENNRIDLLITDFSMPKMNGAQLAVAAREINPGLPILLASGYAELPANINIELPRIAKPYQQSQLATEIARVLKAPVM